MYINYVAIFTLCLPVVQFLVVVKCRGSLRGPALWKAWLKSREASRKGDMAIPFLVC